MEPANDLTKFWGDNFDMDLLQLFPDLRSRLGPFADARVWTLGSVANDGCTFSHPSVWHGYTGIEAFFWAEQPPDMKREGRWIRVDGGRTTDDPWCCLTVLQAIRDCWSHHYNLYLEGKLCLRMTDKFYGSHFYPIMATRRGWQALDIERRLCEVLGWALQAAETMKPIVETKRLALACAFPYLAERKG